MEFSIKNGDINLLHFSVDNLIWNTVIFLTIGYYIYTYFIKGKPKRRYFKVIAKSETGESIISLYTDDGNYPNIKYVLSLFSNVLSYRTIEIQEIK